MAKNLNDSEYWLPSQFLTDDELLMDFKNNPDFKHGFTFNQFGTHSGLGSPVESVDTESDEDEYITELSYKMASSSLHDSGFGYANTKGWNLSGSPQSTLCGCKQGSSTVPRNSNQTSLFYQQLQVAQFQRLKQQQIMKQGQGQGQGQGVLGSSKGGFGQYMLNQKQQHLAPVYGQNGVARSMMNSSNFGGPTMQQSQQQPGSGMRAVFLGNTSGPKKECAGTGVFLPRNIGTQTESRTKPGCSTVLLPDRVVHALNLNLEAMDARTQPQVQARCNNGGGVFTPASGSMYRINMAATQQRRSVRTENTYSQTMSQELRLPQEWTY